MPDNSLSPDPGAIGRVYDIEDRLARILNGSGEFWVEAQEIDGGTDIRLTISDRIKNGPWITVIAETGHDDE